jgi:hypothetical protein
MLFGFLNKDAFKVSKKVKKLGGTVSEQAEAGSAIAADQAEAFGASPLDSVKVAQTTAATIAKDAGAAISEIEQAVNTATANAMGAIKRKNKFGSECSTIPRPHNIENCNYHKIDNKFPCFLTSQGCRVRQDKDLERKTPYFSAVSKKPENVPKPPVVSSPSSVIKCSEIKNEKDCSNYNLNGEYPCFNTKTGCRKRILDKQPRHLPYVKEKTKSLLVKKVLEEYGPQLVPASDLDFGKPKSCKGVILMKKNANKNLKLISIYASRKLKGKPRLSIGKAKSISPAIRKMCKKYRIRLTKKIKGKRVYKSVSVLKKEIKSFR